MWLSRRRSLSVFVTALVLLYLVVQAVLVPIKSALAARYLAKGDALFVDQDYLDAMVQYSRALSYESNNEVAAHNRQMAEAANTDIVQAKPFFEEHGVSEALAKLAEAEVAYPTPKAALTEGVKLYALGEFSYAQYPLLRAVRLDSGYPEAWNYLGLTYEELGKFDREYVKKAVEAYKNRDALTPKYIQ